MAAENSTTSRRLGRLGLGLLSPARGLAALGAIISDFSSKGPVGLTDYGGVMTVSPFDWSRLISQQPREAREGVLLEMGAAVNVSAARHTDANPNAIPTKARKGDGIGGRSHELHSESAHIDDAATVVESLEAMIISEAAAILVGCFDVETSRPSSLKWRTSDGG